MINTLKKIFFATTVFMLFAATSADAITKRHIGIDNVTRSTPMISSDQVGTHEGRVFSLSGASTGLATDTFHWVSITTPATGSIHMKSVDVWSDQLAGSMILLEGPANIAEASGTAFIPINRNRQAGNVSMTSAYNDVNVVPTDLGDAITGAATSTNIVTITGATDTIQLGDAIMISGSTGNDGFYLVAGVSFATPTISITVNSITDATTDGDVYLLGKVLEITTFNAGSTTANHTINLDVEFVLAKSTTYLVGIRNDDDDTAAAIAAFVMWNEEGE